MTDNDCSCVELDSSPIPDPACPLHGFEDPEVHSPSHYTQESMETIDVIENSVPLEHFCGYLRGNILKYMLRYEYKHGIQDLKKAQWYLNRLIKTLT